MLEHLVKAREQGATEGVDGARRDPTERNRNAGLEVSPSPRTKARGHIPSRLRLCMLGILLLLDCTCFSTTWLCDSWF